ncbi:hypothetical protein [Georgenia wangjunii]|uniref:hypothetical protein n=1 Tax=Georgenia wangjunii TaxID=3117730 RepID=UPI002F266C89
MSTEPLPGASSAVGEVAPSSGRRRPSRAAALVRVRRGTYAERTTWENARPAERYRILVQGTLSAMRTPAPLAYESAAIMLGIPIIGAWPDRVHVIEATAAGGRGSAGVTRHGVKRMPDVVMADGVAVTSVARTVLDMARTRTFASALASADHALATGATSSEELAEELDLMRGARGLDRARRVVECADGGAQSVGESLSRARMYELGLPVPELQRQFFDDAGFVGRTDFWWYRFCLIGEFDGRVKFARETARSDEDAREVLWQEKRREDRLRALGNGVVRWDWSDALDIARLGRILAAAGLVPG